MIGETQKFSRTQTFTGNGNNKVFTIDHAATTIEVKIGGTRKTPNEDYELDT